METGISFWTYLVFIGPMAAVLVLSLAGLRRWGRDRH